MGLRTLKELIVVYHSTVGRNCNLELDWAPFQAGPNAGSLPQEQVARFKEFGSWIKGCYGEGNRAAHTSGNTSAVTHTLVLDISGVAKPVDRLVIQEDQSYGQRILSWEVTTELGLQVAAGHSIGNKRIVVLNGTVNSSQLVLKVLQTKAQPVIRALEAYYACPSA